MWIGFVQYIVSLYIRTERGRERGISALRGQRVCVCSFFYAISMIHSLETFKYVTYVIGIKVRPAFLVCSGSSAFVSFSITKLRPHSSHKS